MLGKYVLETCKRNGPRWGKLCVIFTQLPSKVRQNWFHFSHQQRCYSTYHIHYQLSTSSIHILNFSNQSNRIWFGQQEHKWFYFNLFKTSLRSILLSLVASLQAKRGNQFREKKKTNDLQHVHAACNSQSNQDHAKNKNCKSSNEIARSKYVTDFQTRSSSVIRKTIFFFLFFKKEKMICWKKNKSPASKYWQVLVNSWVHA